MLYTPNINIIQIANPLIGKPNHNELAEVSSPPFYKERLGTEFSDKIDVFILAIEGAYLHLDKLDKEKTKELLEDTDKVIKKFYSLDVSLSEKEYFDKEALKLKMKYLFKVLYKFENILHKTIYKDTPISKTPQDIADNISKMNRRNLIKLV